MPLLAWLALAYAGDAEDLAAAMDVPAADIVTATLTGNPVGFDVLPESGIITPGTGADLTYLYTGQMGLAPQPGTDIGNDGMPQDRVSLSLELDVPVGQHSFALDFYFLSAEYPEWVSSSYNDSFRADVSGTAWSGNAAIDSDGNEISVNSVLFTVTSSADLLDTGFDGGVGGGTGWLTVVVPVDEGDTVTLDLDISDVSDGVVDSAVVLDSFHWSEVDIDIPIVVEDVDVDFLSPKRGPAEGGVETTIFGSQFNELCKAYFDGTEAISTSYLDSHTLLVEPPPHDLGIVDVQVRCLAVEHTLLGGYTYYDEEGGGVPPDVQTVTPNVAEVEGGQVVEVLGSDFADGVVVQVDGVGVEATRIDDETLEIVAPAHEPGLASVAVFNPDGLHDELAGALLYVDSPDWPPDEDSGGSDTDDDAKAPNKSGSCDTSPAALGILTALLGALLMRRRR